MCRAYLRYAAGQAENPAGKVSDNLALYVYGLVKSQILSPNQQAQLNSAYFDLYADLRFKINVMSPEEILPMLHP